MESLKKVINVDCAFGGMIYAIVDVDSHPEILPKIEPCNGKALANLGEEIKVHKYSFMHA